MRQSDNNNNNTYCTVTHIQTAYCQSVIIHTYCTVTHIQTAYCQSMIIHTCCTVTHIQTAYCQSMIIHTYCILSVHDNTYILYSNPHTNCILSVRDNTHISPKIFTSLPSPFFTSLHFQSFFSSQFKSLHFTTIFRYRHHVWPLNILQYCTRPATRKYTSTCYIPNRYRRPLLRTILLHVLLTLSLMWCLLSSILQLIVLQNCTFSHIFRHFPSPAVMSLAVSVRLVFWCQLYGSVFIVLGLRRRPRP